MTQAPPPPQPPASPYARAPRVAPSAGWYLISMLFLLVSVGVAGVILAPVFRGMIDVAMPPQFFDAPGQTEQYLDKPGTYAVYLVQPAGEKTAGNPNALKITVTRQGQDHPLPLHKPESGLNKLETNDKNLLALYTFSLAEPGGVKVSAVPAEEGLDIEPMELALGPGFTTKDLANLGGRVFVGVGAGGLGLIVALLVFIVTVIKRSDCKRHRQTIAYARKKPHNPTSM